MTKQWTAFDGLAIVVALIGIGIIGSCLAPLGSIADVDLGGFGGIGCGCPSGSSGGGDEAIGLLLLGGMGLLALLGVAVLGIGLLVGVAHLLPAAMHLFGVPHMQGAIWLVVFLDVLAAGGLLLAG